MIYTLGEILIWAVLFALLGLVVGWLLGRLSRPIDAAAHADVLARELAGVREELAMANHERDTLAGGRAKLNADLDGARADIVNLRRQVAVSHEELARTQHDMRALAAGRHQSPNHTEVARELAEARSRIRELESAEARFDAAVEHIQKLERRLVEQGAAARRRIGDLEPAAARYEAAVEHIHKLERYVAQLTAAQQRARDLEGQAAQLTATQQRATAIDLRDKVPARSEDPD